MIQNELQRKQSVGHRRWLLCAMLGVLQFFLWSIAPVRIMANGLEPDRKLLFYAEEASAPEGEESPSERGHSQEDTGSQTRQVQLELTAPSAIVMEASTGTILYEKDADTRRSPASITKIMTAILIFDALESGQIALEDMVTTSAYAKSMGGSQVYLEQGEQQTVDTMLKCILVASGNDASVAMAEHLCGSESEFVARMNERAQLLGMTNTHFEDCCGLTDSDGHYTSARDIARMSRELLTRYPQVTQYTTIWMENMIHETAQGSSEFGLTNTNKLLKQYQWATGLKTGSTEKAKYCLSASAKKDGIEMIAVVLACPNYKERFPEAAALLNYGYSCCRRYEDQTPPAAPKLPVSGGTVDQVQAEYHYGFTYLDFEGRNLDAIEKELILESLTAPIEKGSEIARVEYRLDGALLGTLPLFAQEEVSKAGYSDYWRRLWKLYLPGLMESGQAGS